MITKVDGKPIVKMSELQEMINAKRPGDKITLTYLRNKKEDREDHHAEERPGQHETDRAG